MKGEPKKVRKENISSIIVLKSMCKYKRLKFLYSWVSLDY